MHTPPRGLTVCTSLLTGLILKGSGRQLQIKTVWSEQLVQQELVAPGTNATEPFVKRYFAIPCGLTGPPKGRGGRETIMGVGLLCSPLRLTVQWSQGLTALKTATCHQKIPQDFKTHRSHPPSLLIPSTRCDIKETDPHVIFTFPSLRDRVPSPGRPELAT